MKLFSVGSSVVLPNPSRKLLGTVLAQVVPLWPAAEVWDLVPLSVWSASDGSTQTLERVITSYYRRILGRAPDAEGLDFWVKRVLSQELTLSAVRKSLEGSAEAQSRWNT